MASTTGARTFKGPDGPAEAEKFIDEVMKDWSSGKGKLPFLMDSTAKLIPIYCHITLLMRQV